VQGPVRAGVALLIAALAALGVTSSGASHQLREAASAPPCFGAAARDPQFPCHNPGLRLMVVPAPSDAPRLPNSPCAPLRSQVGPRVCEFGTAGGAGAPTVALVGDSHAGHWRGALETVAQANGWHGLSITHTSCPLAKALRNLPEPARSRCIRWKRDVFAWFGGHPEVGTVFVAGLSGGAGVVPTRGRSEFETSVAGYEAAWRALPPTVRRIVVIRDTPKGRAHGKTLDCVQRVMAQRRPPGTGCALPRREALVRDPAATAAFRLRSRRVSVVDMTQYFCGRRCCYPVIGGALVLRDQNHMTGVFSATLGPFLLRAVDELTRG
jgi:hypothetical protein